MDIEFRKCHGYCSSGPPCVQTWAKQGTYGVRFRRRSVGNIQLDSFADCVGAHARGIPIAGLREPGLSTGSPDVTSTLLIAALNSRGWVGPGHSRCRCS